MPVISDKLKELLANEHPEPVRGAIAAGRKSSADLALLLSPGADSCLEEMAVAARAASLRNFGRTIGLYMPLYLSNHCSGHCPYCGFRRDAKIPRASLSLEEIVEECRVIASSGMRHVLLVSGDAPRDVDVDYLAQAITHLKTFMSHVSIEVAALSTEHYLELASAGLDGVTLYQETYDHEIYRQLHDGGPKEDFEHRLSTLDRAGAAGIHTLTLGALWGLAPWRQEALMLGLHAFELQKKWWRSRIQLGMPRLKHVPDDFVINNPIDDRTLTHILVAMRLFIEEMGLALSTREPPKLRDALISLGVTQMSAGSSTRPGGYSGDDSLGDQFEVVDLRSPAQVARVLKDRGYDPVWKDWDEGFGHGGTG